jgi:Holliday junction DNA helicase RuvA
MYEYFNGILAQKDPLYAILEVNGIAFYINIPLSTYEKLPVINSNLKLFIHHQQSEDAVRLYGFFTQSERQLFRLLMSISGVGPKLSMAVLSGLPVSRVISAIINGDINTLSTVPGLGKKSAARLVVELKDKISFIEGEDTGIINSTASETVLSAETALINLGYTKTEVRRTLNFLNESHEYDDVQKLIKEAIKLLYKKGNL